MVQERDRMDGKRMFVICTANGTVRDAETAVLAEVQAEDPLSALKPFMTGLRKTWEIHADTHTNKYAQAENPTSFVSDMIDNISARAGHLKRNDKGELCFTVCLDNWEMGMEKKVLKEWTVWASSPEAAIEQCVKKKHKELEFVESQSGEYKAVASCSEVNIFYSAIVNIEPE